MADNFPATPGSGRNVATDQVTYSGDTADVQIVRKVRVTGAEGSKTVVEEPAGAGAVDSGTPRVTLATDDAAIALLLGRIGEVQASPTSLTVLDRLKTIASALSGLVLGAGSAVVGKVGIDQTTPGTTDSVSVKGNGYRSAPTVTRPANTTAYTAGDVVGGVITFTSAGPSGGDLLITTADLRIDVAAVPSGMTTFRLYLYDASPASAIADNAAWDLPSGDRANFLGYIDLGTPVDLGSTLYTQANQPGLQVRLASASTSLWAYLVTTSGFTPAANSEVYVPRLKGVGV
jgi:hypothetical protein